MTYDQQYKAYTNASHMVRKTKQVVMLYEGAIRSVQQAKKAIEDNDIQQRFNSLTKACEIINGLQLSLDHNNGGDVAQLLSDYYSGLDMRLSSIHQSNDSDLCDTCTRHLKTMKEAWEEIDNNSDNSKQTSSDQNIDISDPNIARPLAEAAENICVSV